MGRRVGTDRGKSRGDSGIRSFDGQAWIGGQNRANPFRLLRTNSNFGDVRTGKQRTNRAANHCFARDGD
jgi:hypothetical protein